MVIGVHITESPFALKCGEENSSNWKSQKEEGEPRNLPFCWRNLQIGPLTWRINHFLLQFFTISQKSLCTCTSLCWLDENTMESKLILIRILFESTLLREFQIDDCIFQSQDGSEIQFVNFKGQISSLSIPGNPINITYSFHWGSIIVFIWNPLI